MAPIIMDEAQAELDKAAAKYRRTYDRLYLRAMRANGPEECNQIDRQLAAATMEYDAAKRRFAEARGQA